MTEFRGRSKMMNKNPTEFSSLSDDLTEEIFFRVPIKPLHRSKCVCKAWRNFLSSPTFNHNIKERFKSLPPLITGLFCTDVVANPELGLKIYVSTEVNFYGISNEMSSDLSLSFLEKSVVVVASHNGILLCSVIPLHCARDSLNRCVEYVVCNPLTRKYVSLPKSGVEHDAKSVVLYCYEKNLHTEIVVLSFLKCGSRLHKYCSETREWNVSSIVGKPRGVRLSYESCCHVLFDGCVYICASKLYLCVYDLREDITRFLKLPRADWEILSQCLGVSSGLLHYAESNGCYIRVWVLVDGVEWALIHRVAYENLFIESPKRLPRSWFPGSLFPFHLLCFRPSNCSLLLVESDSGEHQFVHQIDDTRTVEINKISTCYDFPVISYSLPSWPPCIGNI